MSNCNLPFLCFLLCRQTHLYRVVTSDLGVKDRSLGDIGVQFWQEFYVKSPHPCVQL